MKLNQKIEEEIKKQACKFYEKGRPQWDIPHVICAVKWMRKLITAESGNERILIPAIYLHDIGYPKLRKGYEYDEVMEAKLSHAEIGAKNAKKILKKLNFTPEEINRIAYLIANHDKHNKITEHDRQLVFEADGLAQIDWRDCPPSFDKKNTIIWLDRHYKKRRQYMKTKTGKKAMTKLEKEAKEYIKNWPTK